MLPFAFSMASFSSEPSVSSASLISGFAYLQVIQFDMVKLLFIFFDCLVPRVRMSSSMPLDGGKQLCVVKVRAFQ